ncbi:MAG: hypothetical protein ACYDD2_03825 [Candidatus Acidiferrales bacterium]
MWRIHENILYNVKHFLDIRVSLRYMQSASDRRLVRAGNLGSLVCTV